MLLQHPSLGPGPSGLGRCRVQALTPLGRILSRLPVDVGIGRSGPTRRGRGGDATGGGMGAASRWDPLGWSPQQLLVKDCLQGQGEDVEDG